MSFWAVARICSQPARRISGDRYCSRVQLLLDKAGFETYQPWMRARLHGQARIAELFPGYLFVRIIDRWWQVRWTPGVLDVLKAGGKPSQLHQDVIDDLRRNEVHGIVQLQKKPQFIKGQRVRVATGQFCNHIGLYEGQTKHEREIVLLNLLGRMSRVELAAADRVEVA